VLETSVLTFETHVDPSLGEIPQSAIGSKLTDASDPTGDTSVCSPPASACCRPKGASASISCMGSTVSRLHRTRCRRPRTATC
jgi:hypothetical protein